MHTTYRVFATSSVLAKLFDGFDQSTSITTKLVTSLGSMLSTSHARVSWVDRLSGLLQSMKVLKLTVGERIQRLPFASFCAFEPVTLVRVTFLGLFWNYRSGIFGWPLLRCVSWCDIEWREHIRLKAPFIFVRHRNSETMTRGGWDGSASSLKVPKLEKRIPLGDQKLRYWAEAVTRWVTQRAGLVNEPSVLEELLSLRRERKWEEVSRRAMCLNSC